MPEVNITSAQYNKPLNEVLDAIVADMTELRAHMILNVADIAALRSAAATLATKLNSDGGVTDTDYAAPAAITGSDPAALTTTIDS